jgi:hypothetical protein
MLQVVAGVEIFYASKSNGGIYTLYLVISIIFNMSHSIVGIWYIVGHFKNLSYWTEV